MAQWGHPKKVICFRCSARVRFYDYYFYPPARFIFLYVVVLFILFFKKRVVVKVKYIKYKHVLFLC